MPRHRGADQRLRYDRRRPGSGRGPGVEEGLQHHAHRRRRLQARYRGCRCLQADVGPVAFGRGFISNRDLPKRTGLGFSLSQHDPSPFCAFDARGHTDFARDGEARSRAVVSLHGPGGRGGVLAEVTRLRSGPWFVTATGRTRRRCHSTSRPIGRPPGRRRNRPSSARRRSASQTTRPARGRRPR